MRISIEPVRLSELQQGPIQHESLSTDLMPRIEATYRAIGHYQCPTLEQWEVGFMHDMNPEGEVAAWEVLAKAFQLYKIKCWKGGRLKRQQAKSIVSTLSVISMGAPLAEIKENAIVKRQLLHCFQVSGGYVKPPMIAKNSSPLPTSANRTLTVAIDSLFAADGISINTDMLGIIVSANVIVGHDVMSGHEFIAFGRDVIERIASTGRTEGVSLLKVELDQETNELEKLIALCQVTKGRDDYDAGLSTR